MAENQVIMLAGLQKPDSPPIMLETPKTEGRKDLGTSLAETWEKTEDGDEAAFWVSRTHLSLFPPPILPF